MRISAVHVALWMASAVSTGCPPSGSTSANEVESAARLDTGALNTGVAGARVRIQGRVTRVQDDSPYGHKLWVDDGTGEAQVFIDGSTQLIRHTGAWRVEDELVVTGDVAKYQDRYELLPRTTADIRVVDRAAD